MALNLDVQGSVNRILEVSTVGENGRLSWYNTCNSNTQGMKVFRMKVFNFTFSNTGNKLYVGLDRTILFEFARQSAGLWLPKNDFLGLFLGGEPVDANEVEEVCLHSFHEVSESIRSKGIEWGYKSHCKYRNHDSQVLGVLVGTPVTKLCHIIDGFWYAQSSPFSGYHSSRDHSVLSYLKSDVQQQIRGRFAMLDMALHSRLDVNSD